MISEYNFDQEIPKGWVCPRCHKINAPWIPACNCTIDSTITCNKNSTITCDKVDTDSEWWKPYVTSDTFKIHPESSPKWDTSVKADLNESISAWINGYWDKRNECRLTKYKEIY